MLNTLNLSIHFDPMWLLLAVIVEVLWEVACAVSFAVTDDVPDYTALGALVRLRVRVGRVGHGSVPPVAVVRSWHRCCHDDDYASDMLGCQVVLAIIFKIICSGCSFEAAVRAYGCAPRRAYIKEAIGGGDR
ncbi:hypothetical protein CMI37_03845 [Candidatus Pacearchaeota archaeon]|nr:hypothetical protein [Candidatus Pacearchaeota archaeon]